MKRLSVFALLLFFPALAFAQNSARMLSGVNPQTGVSYTFVAQDATRLTTFANGASVGVTLPSPLSQGFGLGTVFSVQNLGSGTVTITCTSCLIYANGASGAGTLTLAAGSGADIYSGGTSYSAFLGSGSGGGGGGGGNTTSTSLTTGYLPKANGANSIINSQVDEGITHANALNIANTGGVYAPFYTATGSTTGVISLGCSGTDPGIGSGVAMTVTNGGCTPYTIYLPNGPNSGYWQCVNSAGKVVCIFEGAINLASSDVTGITPLTAGGTGNATQSGALINIMPPTSSHGAIVYWGGSVWTLFNGCTTSTCFFTENGGGVAGWVQSPIPVVDGGTNSTNPTPVAGSGISITGTWPNNTISATGPNFDVTAYGAVADGSTDNTTAITSAFAASNAVTKGIPTVFFHCQTGKGCQYNYGGSSTSPINPTIATNVQCDYGVILNYTGSAHALDIGPTGLSAPQSPFPIYRVTGCQIIWGSSATDGTYVTAYTQIEFDHNSCPTTGTVSTSSWCMETGGENYWVSVHDNNCTQINKFANCFKAKDSGDGNTQAHFKNNYGGCVLANTGGDCSVTVGVGIWAEGYGSEVVGNDFDRMQPNVQIGPHSAGTVISNNNLETSVTNYSCMQFGDTGDGSNTKVSDLTITGNYCNVHSVSGGAFLGPQTANDLLVDAVIENNKVTNAPGPLVILNQATTQTGNQAKGNTCASGFAFSLPCYNLHTNAGGSAVAMEPWLTFDHLNYSDGFTRSNGSLTTPWLAVPTTTLPTITSNVLGCGSVPCQAQYSYDIPDNQRVGIQFNTVPTGTDNIGVWSRTMYSGSTLAGYNCYYINGTGIQLSWQSGGSGAQLGSNYTATTPTAGSWMEIESIGTVQTCYLNGVPIITANDTNVAHGYAAISIGHGTTGKIGAFLAKGLP